VDTVLHLTARLALVGTLLLLPRFLVLLADDLGGLSRRRALLCGGGLALALLLRLAVPGAMVEVFTGYGLLDAVAQGGPVPKYGAGQAAFLAPLFALVGMSEQAVFALHAVLGSATVGLWAVLVSRWRSDAVRPAVQTVELSTGSGPAPGNHARDFALPLALWAGATLPLLLWHDRSEAATVPAAFALALALVHAQQAQPDQHGLPERIGAVLALALAAHTRPELLLSGPLLLAWVVRAHGTWGPLWRTPTFLALLLLAPQVWHVAGRGIHHAAAGDLPALWTLPLTLPVVLPSHHLALWPHAFPLAATILGVWGGYHAWRQARDRSLVRMLAVAAVVLVVPALADPVVVSLPRLQAPLLGLWAAGAATLATRWLAGKPRRLQVWGAVAWVLTALATVPWVFRRDNADYEAELLSAVAQHLTGKRGTLHLLGYDDEGADKVSRHQPAYRFRPPYAYLRVRPLRELPPVADAEPRWVLLGVRCHARHREPGTPAPLHLDQPACGRIRQRRDLQPIFERTLANRGDVHFSWWPRQPRLSVGLYALGSTTGSP